MPRPDAPRSPNERRAFAGDGYMMPDCAFVHYAVEEHPVRLVAVDSLAADGSAKGDLCHARLAALDAILVGALARNPAFTRPSGDRTQ